MINYLPPTTATSTSAHLRTPNLAESLPLGWAPEASLSDETVTPESLEAQQGYQAYLQQATQHDLLDAAEELRLATIIQAGLSPEAELTMTALAARNRLVSHNLKLAIYYANRFGRTEDERELLNSAANQGLLVAAERFRPEKQVRFATYAGWTIYSYVMAEIGQRRVVLLPRNIRESLTQLGRAQNRLFQALGRVATDAELAAELNYTEAKVVFLLAQAQRHVSLDQPIEDGSEATHGDYLSDEASSPADQAMRLADAQHLRTLFPKLDAREALILQLRHGILDGHDWTLDEIGTKLQVSRERVRQLEERAGRKLRELLAPASTPNA